jgi:hypothetical protein
MNKAANIQFRDEDFIMSSYTFVDAKSACVMVARRDGITALRDSKDTSKTTLYYTEQEWTAFLKGVKDGEFDF